MKRINLLFVLLAMLFAGINTANAQKLTDLLKKGTSGTTISDVLSGVLSSSDVNLTELTGEWKSNGPAISFKGDNFLKKAGGVAAATALKNKIKPYYEKYGLSHATLIIDSEANFEFKFKRLSLKGKIVEDPNAKDKGIFIFKFQAAGKINLGSVTTYIQKTSSTMNVMFDATKLKTIVSAVASHSGISMAKTLGSLLDKYDGLCVGFAYDKVK